MAKLTADLLHQVQMLNLKRLPTEDLHGTRQLTNSPISSEPASGVNGGGKVDHMGGSMKFQQHTLQLLPDRQRRSYAGAAVMVLHGLDGRLSLQHEGRIIAAQEAPPSPGSLRNGIKPSSGDASQSLDPKGLSEPRETAPEPLTMVAAANKRSRLRHRR